MPARSSKRKRITSTEEGKGKEEHHDPLTNDLEKLVWAIDASYTCYDPSTGEGVRIIGEFFLNHQEFAEPETGDESDMTAFGGYVYGEYSFNRQWSLGASVNWLERAENDDKEWFDAGAFVTYRVNEFNRLRLEARYVDDQLLDEDYFVGMLQWTVILGSHGHGIPW